MGAADTENTEEIQVGHSASKEHVRQRLEITPTVKAIACRSATGARGVTPTWLHLARPTAARENTQLVYRHASSIHMLSSTTGTSVHFCWGEAASPPAHDFLRSWLELGASGRVATQVAYRVTAFVRSTALRHLERDTA